MISENILPLLGMQIDNSYLQCFEGTWGEERELVIWTYRDHHVQYPYLLVSSQIEMKDWAKIDQLSRELAFTTTLIDVQC